MRRRSVLLLGALGIIFLFSVFFRNFQTNTKGPTLSPLPRIQRLFALPTIAKKEEHWTLLLTGDIIPARVVNQITVKRNDFLWPLRGIEPVLKDADITVTNLESPLLTNCPIMNEGFKFCGDARFAKALADAGIDVVNVANNHSLNFGWEGLKETEKHLSDAGIAITGFSPTYVPISACIESLYCSRLLIKTIKGVRIGFLGYNAVGQRLEEEIIQKDFATIRPKVDVFIVSVHWGKEYERTPMPDTFLAPDDPRVWGKWFIDHGADVVAGNHPHWYQGIEWYKGKPIFYAQGNTVFDQEWSTETKRGYLAKLTFTNNRLTKNDITIFPIGIKNWGEAYVLEGKEKEEVLQFISSSP